VLQIYLLKVSGSNGDLGSKSNGFDFFFGISSSPASSYLVYFFGCSFFFGCSYFFFSAGFFCYLGACFFYSFFYSFFYWTG